MTPQEQELVNELFDRLTKLESNPRDPGAERLIADGLRRAPHAAYALVQTALVQDEALKRANARIEELQAQVGGEEQQRSGGFLDSMRDAVLGRSEPRGSVPSVHSQAPSSPTTAPQPVYPPPYPTGPGLAPGMGPTFGSGGSFLGTAASTAAGVIGGGLLLNSIRSMFGDHAGLGGHERSAFGSSSSTASGNLAQKDHEQERRSQSSKMEPQAQVFWGSHAGRDCVARREALFCPPHGTAVHIPFALATLARGAGSLPFTQCSRPEWAQCLQRLMEGRRCFSGGWHWQRWTRRLLGWRCRSGSRSLRRERCCSWLP